MNGSMTFIQNTKSAPNFLCCKMCTKSAPVLLHVLPSLVQHMILRNWSYNTAFYQTIFYFLLSRNFR